MAGDGKEKGVNEEKIADFMKVDLYPLNMGFHPLYTLAMDKIGGTIKDASDEIRFYKEEEEIERKVFEAKGEEVQVLISQLMALGGECQKLLEKELKNFLLRFPQSLDRFENLVNMGKEISCLGERLVHIRNMKGPKLNKLLQGTSECKINNRRKRDEDEEGDEDEERPRKKQKLEEEGESSAMGAATKIISGLHNLNKENVASVVTAADQGGDASKVLAFEQRIRKLESIRDAYECALEKETAAHHATLRSLRALQCGVEAEGRLLQDTTD